MDVWGSGVQIFCRFAAQMFGSERERASGAQNKEQPSFHTTLHRGTRSGPGDGEIVSDTLALPHWRMWRDWRPSCPVSDGALMPPPSPAVNLLLWDVIKGLSSSVRAQGATLGASTLSRPSLSEATPDSGRVEGVTPGSILNGLKSFYISFLPLEDTPLIWVGNWVCPPWPWAKRQNEGDLLKILLMENELKEISGKICVWWSYFRQVKVSLKFSCILFNKHVSLWAAVLHPP